MYGFEKMFGKFPSDCNFLLSIKDNEIFYTKVKS